MKKLTKNYKNGLSKIDAQKSYSLDEASELVKEVTYTKFDASIDIAVRLGVDPRKPEQMVRGVVTLPNGIGKTVRVLALVTPEKEQEAKDSGADYVGMDEYLQKIKSGWVDVDVIVTMPSVMVKLGPLGKVLGPRGLMPNPKTGTVTNDIGKAVSEVKGGKINFKVDKTSIIHSTVGRKSFSAKKISENIMEFMETIVRLKPSTAKGNYIKTVYLSGTMSPSIPIDIKQFS